MPDLDFQVEGVESVPYAAAPLLAFKLRLTNADAQERIQTVALKCQLQLEVTRRRYKPEEQAQLYDLFGEPERWGQTLRSMLWTFASVIVPPFCGSTAVDLHVPCTYDFNVAATKYFYGLQEGDIPLDMLFSGTIFYETADGSLQVAQIPWEKEARHRLPVQVWREMMGQYYPNSAYLTLHQDVFDQLYRYKLDHALPTWEQVIDSLLRSVPEGASGTLRQDRPRSQYGF